MSSGDFSGDVGGTLADQEAAMKKGKGRSLVLFVAFGALLVGLLFFLMGGGDERRVYSELGRKINRVKLEGFDRFWGCALKGEDLRTIKSNTDLTYHLMGRAARVGRPYAQHLRDSCLPLLADIEPELDVLIVHDAELKADVSRMSEATGDLRSALGGLVSYLDKDELEFEEAMAQGHIKKIARAWYEFRKASSHANKLIKGKLEG
ncbi:MAG: hypothetical protein OXU20_16120 [Myxococcales bacterium]|nr:hypothetical protein [Myxococcales bacterium]MDD9971487.1 hypothetical protein [Myxococcales bacterium]